MTRDLVSGEILEITHSYQAPGDECLYFRIIRMKTAILFGSCMGLPMLLSENPNGSTRQERRGEAVWDRFSDRGRLSRLFLDRDHSGETGDVRSRRGQDHTACPLGMEGRLSRNPGTSGTLHTERQGLSRDRIPREPCGPGGRLYRQVHRHRPSIRRRSTGRAARVSREHFQRGTEPDVPIYCRQGVLDDTSTECNAGRNVALGNDLYRRIPAHVAIIMDGNGRWAEQREHSRVKGHKAGIRAIKNALSTTLHLKIPVITLYAFSTENWERPRFEVSVLMTLLRQFIRLEMKTIMDNEIRLHAAMATLSRIPAEISRGS
ncbi:MAG: polyprenyl diphosphate synthase [Marinilabiliales bacterium]|nr:polyprenyl diphosphate synthase [Marinilabiliales bacterium]